MLLRFLKTVQNELITGVVDPIDMKSACLYSVITDEMMDRSYSEQMSPCLHFVLNGTIHE